MCLKAGGSTRNEGEVTYPEICCLIGRSSIPREQEVMTASRQAIQWVSVWYKPGASGANALWTNGV